MSAQIHVNAVAPYVLTVTITGGSAGADDLNAVSAATLEVDRGSTSSTWECTISAQSTASITLVYAFVAGDVPTKGRLRLVPVLVTAGGNLIAESFLLTVTP